MINNTDLETILHLRSNIPLIDVRSPCEFEKGHIPGSLNIPLFTNEERAEIGTLYKEEGQEKAIELGETYAIPRIDWYLSRVKEASSSDHVALYCYRGGMRSGRFSELLDSRGWNVSRLTGGYKSYRRKAKERFAEDLPLLILGGKTGSGKTEVLIELRKKGEAVIDLEGLASHRGSAFGNIGLDEQPTTEQFENNLYEKILEIGDRKPLWLEDESAGIGRIFLPDDLFATMRRSPMVVLDIPSDIRVERLCREYTQWGKEPLLDAVTRITRRLGGDRAAKAIDAIEKDNLSAAASIVLGYYDKCYDYGMNKDGQRICGSIKLETGNPSEAAEELLKLKDSLFP
ncbi:tRNA 2-selenouridine(34) synthase MnmH [Spirochaeta isovalerica]|uniref:tRNA 2-selenouridine synthase n=1 Tax=Spirochaeta isovalerica TaxID=150 RepID=A0A841R4B7_9SPIO|nr:tRNA 2-selenouridine(34) synthase MnmH [Spirochaeta isovalerica]MBB6478656.1 tRNA 2-selenouridine synthase [Spirochaeta isovalerica]